MVILYYILGGLAALIVLVAIIAALQPTQFAITRSATMNAPPARVFDQVNDFRKWEAWSPWEKLDPNLQRTYGGAPAGVGANYRWLGNKKVGEGEMTITESRAPELIRLDLHFIKPFNATNVTEFKFQPAAGGTNMTWTMTGERNFMFKLMGLMMNMDKMIGADFERGLANIKAVVES
jgi:uncharacterized protein YndB with AHSA1/START domain